jgi:cellobiose epimerase
LDFISLQKEFMDELTGNILNYWKKEVYDPDRRTFYGRITNEGEKFPEAVLSAVFTTRIMWAFSAAFRIFPTAANKQMADEAFRIMRDMFTDSRNGGIYWSVLPDGTAPDTKKQFYAEAFYIYALSEYYIAFNDEAARDLAIQMFGLIEKHAFDKEHGGYIEAKTHDWQDIEDMRLSSKELNVKKSMNTHLHILEAYTNLYRIWKAEDCQKQLRHLIRLFLDRIIDAQTYHFHLFFDDDWTVRSNSDSYGHDIEGSWLLYEAADVLGDATLKAEVEQMALKMAAATASEGISNAGGVYYEKQGNHLLEQYDWWPQTEAVVGFFNAWQLSGEVTFLERAVQSWEFIKRYIIDRNKGEWYWGVTAELEPLNTDKINDWKAPYHNGRMCMEMMRRLEEQLK